MCSHGSVLSKSRPFRQGEQPEDCHILLDGFVYRYTVFEDGGARYFLFMCLVTLMTLCTSYCLKLITTSPPSPRGTVALVSHQAIIELTEQFPRIARALWKETLIEAAMFREWIASLAAKVPMGGLPI
jgi:hypothetical protein